MVVHVMSASMPNEPIIISHPLKTSSGHTKHELSRMVSRLMVTMFDGPPGQLKTGRVQTGTLSFLPSVDSTKYDSSHESF